MTNAGAFRSLVRKTYSVFVPASNHKPFRVYFRAFINHELDDRVRNDTLRKPPFPSDGLDMEVTFGPQNEVRLDPVYREKIAKSL